MDFSVSIYTELMYSVVSAYIILNSKCNAGLAGCCLPPVTDCDCEKNE